MVRFELKRHQSIALCCLAGVVLLIFGSIRVLQWLHDPQVFLLANHGQVKWIRHYIPFRRSMDTYFEPIHTTFHLEFVLPKPAENATLFVRAFRTCDVWIDTEPDASPPIFRSSGNLDDWKQRHEVVLSTLLNPGSHHLWIKVTNRAAYPCLLAYSPELGITTDSRWDTSLDQSQWQEAIAADVPARDVAVVISRSGYPDVPQSFRSLGPWLVAIFVAAFAAFWWTSGPAVSQRWTPASERVPGLLRWGLLCAWVVMSINNMIRIDHRWGFDLESHIEYVTFLVQQHRIPLATDGWQMFQSPLMYLLATPWYALITSWSDAATATKALRILPLLCGLFQIELAYRIGRQVFPGRFDLQSITLVIAGMMPMNIYMSQAFGNEPLASSFTSLLVLLCFKLLMNPTSGMSPWYYCVVGAIWGMALLSKVTPILMAPILLSVIVFRAWLDRCSWRTFLVRLMAMGTTCALISGWYFIRNWILLGRPFIGGWDAERKIQWWQDPSYRTWKQLTLFGDSLIQPVYACVIGFWDSMYSTMWVDGIMSGLVAPAKDVPWNLLWLEVGAGLSLLPLGCILVGAVRFASADLKAARGCLLFSIAAIGIYLAVMFDLYVHVPIFSQAKATYMLGLLPCFAILAAAGAAPLLHYRWSRAVLLSLLTVWCVSNYAAYFCLK